MKTRNGKYSVHHDRYLLLMIVVRAGYVPGWHPETFALILKALLPRRPVRLLKLVVGYGMSVLQISILFQSTPVCLVSAQYLSRFLHGTIRKEYIHGFIC